MNLNAWDLFSSGLLVEEEEKTTVGTAGHVLLFGSRGGQFGKPKINFVCATRRSFMTLPDDKREPKKIGGSKRIKQLFTSSQKDK